MSRSSFVEVNITNPTKLAQDSQNTADNAVKGVTNLNDPNLMSVIEKQNNIGQFAGLTSQYNVLIQNAKDEGINTGSLTTAYNNLNKFMVDVLTDPDHASDVDRKTYKNYQDAYNSELAKIQTALKNNTDGKFTSAASATSQAASTASQAAGQAQFAVDYTNSQIASQASAVSEASKSASEASSQANNALDTATSATAEITKLKGGSTLTIAELENGLGTKVSNDTFTTYQTQTASQFAETVKEADFQTYQTQTSKLIESKVDNGTYQTDKTQTANDIASKVASKDFETYKTQTDGMIASKVSNKDANNVNLIPYSSNFSDSLEGWQLTGWGATDKKLLVTTHNFYQNGTGKLLYLDTAQNATAPAYSLRFSVLPNTKYTFQFKAFASSNVVGANVYFLSRAYGSTNDYDTVHGLFTSLVTSPSHIDQYTVTFTTGANDNEGYIRVDNIGSNNGASSGLFFTELKMEPGDTATPYVYGGQDSMIAQMSDDIDIRVKKGDSIDDINVKAGKTLISSSGQLTLAGNTIYFDTKNPVIIPSANMDSVLVDKKLTAADISANTFSTNNETFTVDKNGAITAKNMTLNGGTLTSPTINTSTINGSTINGTTFHGGDIISDSNNTSQLYPTTISSNGHIYTTGFNSADAMQTDLSTGSLTTKYRATNSSSNQYEAYDTNISPNQIVLLAGHTNGKDMSFSQSVTGSNQDGYVLISPLDGITIHGDTQQIHFNGTSTDVTPKGIAFTPYGNINATGTQGTWYIGNNSNMLTASFGIDNQNNNHIGFYRPLFVDEIGAISSSNGGALFLHGQNNSTGQILLKKDSTGPQVLSASIYNRTYSGGSTVTVTGVGTLGRITSASKYKLAIAREPQVESADRLLTIDPSSWVDLEAAKAVARNKSNGEALLEHEQSLNRYHGLIAEDLRDAGLDEFVIYGKNGEIEGIQYDRLWTVLIPKIKQLNERLNELERKSI
ncbi:hypothetical protein [Lactiplantibacillus plantarum]|uniref:hypothetical protein n=1 Tax=Lactiplantibacillus plantarum TaxID=1590 RepID=UPI003F533BD7